MTNCKSVDRKGIRQPHSGICRVSLCEEIDVDGSLKTSVPFGILY